MVTLLFNGICLVGRCTLDPSPLNALDSTPQSIKHCKSLPHQRAPGQTRSRFIQVQAKHGGETPGVSAVVRTGPPKTRRSPYHWMDSQVLASWSHSLMYTPPERSEACAFGRHVPLFVEHTHHLV